MSVTEFSRSETNPDELDPFSARVHQELAVVHQAFFSRKGVRLSGSEILQLDRQLHDTRQLGTVALQDNL